jgi:hypothetical protein
VEKIELSFLPVSAAPASGNLMLLENALEAAKLTPIEIFRDLRDGWDPAIYAAGKELLTNKGLWDLGRSILRNNRDADAERQAKKVKKAKAKAGVGHHFLTTETV